MKLKWDSKTKLGIIFSVASLFFYSIINIFSQTFGDLLLVKYWPPIIAVVFVGVKELAAIISSFTISNKKMGKRIKDIFMKNKKIFNLSCVAGIFGGAIGFSLTTAGGLYISSGMASPFYSIEIIIVLIVVKILFNRKPNYIQILGISIIGISIILLPSLDILLNKNIGNSKNIILGITLITSGVVCWSIETIIFDLISENEEISISSIVQLKQISSIIFILLFLFPTFSLINNHNVYSTYVVFGTLFKENWKSLLVGIASGLLLFLGRVLFYEGTKILGATTSNAIYSLVVMVQIPISFLANLITQNSVNYLGNIHHEYFWVLMLILVFGVITSLYGQHKNNYAKL